MLVINDITDERLITILRSGGIAVIRTDTLYGLVAQADNKEAVERVYLIKGRDPHKSCIVLLDKPESSFGHSEELSGDIGHYHDVPTSFLIDAENAPRHLLRENTQLAYRVPAADTLRGLIAQTGPLVAPSANPESAPPARTIQEAIDYFSDMVDIYVDGGEVPINTPPSLVLRIHADGSFERLR